MRSSFCKSPFIFEAYKIALLSVRLSPLSLLGNGPSVSPPQFFRLLYVSCHIKGKKVLA
jgi:hypothetical protein